MAVMSLKLKTNVEGIVHVEVTQIEGQLALLRFLSRSS